MALFSNSRVSLHSISIITNTDFDCFSLMAETLDYGAEVVNLGMLQAASKMEMESGEVKEMKSSFRAEIDTSAPFESVKEAANHFGGIGFWRPHHHNKLSETEHVIEEVDIGKAKEQAAELEKDLIAKERETLEVLKELETTKLIVEEIKLKLQKEASAFSLETNTSDRSTTPFVREEEKENHPILEGSHQNVVGGLNLCPSSAPGLILMELKRAKLNLNRTTSDLSDIRASVELFNKKIEEERISLEKTRKRLTSNSSKISSLEGELQQTRKKLLLAKDAEIKRCNDNPVDISRTLQTLNSEALQFKKIGEETKSEVLRAMSEIEQTKTRIKTAEIRLVAAKKMKQAARAAEAVAFAEIKALSNRENSSGILTPKPEEITLSFEEYSSLAFKAREAEELSKRRVIDAMVHVDEANVSKMEILKMVGEATEEVKASKKVLEEALNRVEAANKEKLSVEEALRKWRSEHGRKRRSVHNSAKFKTSTYPTHHRKDSRLIDVNGLNLVNDESVSVSVPVLKPTLSIGQILSRKLLQPEGFEVEMQEEISTVNEKVSLGQMLTNQNGDISISRKAEKENGHKQFSAKRKKFGFGRFSLLLTKQSKKKKKSSNFRTCSG